MTTPTILVGVSFRDSVRSRDVARKFFEGFASIYPELSFKFMREPWMSRRENFDPIKALDKWGQDRGGQGVVHGGCEFEGVEPASFSVGMRWHGPGTHTVWSDGIGVVFDESYWLDTKIDEPSSRAIQLLRMLTTLRSPLYGRAYHWSEFEAKGFIATGSPDGQTTMGTISLRPREGLEDIFWLNYFGKPYVDIFGTHAFSKVASTSKEVLGDGYLLVYGRDPFEWKLPEVRALQERTKQELDHGVFYDKTRNVRPALNLFSKT